MEDEVKRTSSFMLFVVLAYAAIWGLFGLGKWLAIPFSMDPRTPGGVFYLIGAALPSSCAIVAVLSCEGWAGLRRLMQRSLAWRFAPFWYPAAILIPVLVTGINAMIAIWFLGRSAPQQWFAPAFGPGFLVFFLVYNGLGEEIGWRGLALPVLQRHLGSLGGNSTLGVIWALWHLPLFWLPGSYQYGDSITLFVLLLTCWSIIMGMLVNKCGGSILVAILFHESANFIAFTLRYPSAPYGYLVWALAAVPAIVFLPRPYFRPAWKT